MAEIIYVDMDNTICDMKTMYKNALEENPGIKFPQSQHGFFRYLEAIPGAIRTVNHLRLLPEYEVKFLTRPSTINRLCYTEKADWIFNYFGQWGVDNLYIVPDKSLMIADFLVDDTPWPGFKGKQLLFGSGLFPTWSEVYEFFKK